jgi:hypothetical protein
MKISRDAYIQLITEQLGLLNSNDDMSLDISLELCRSYSKMVTDAFDKAGRYSENKEDVQMQFEIIKRHLDNLKNEMAICEKIISKKK